MRDVAPRSACWLPSPSAWGRPPSRPRPRPGHGSGRLVAVGRAGPAGWRVGKRCPVAAPCGGPRPSRNRTLLLPARLPSFCAGWTRWPARSTVASTLRRARSSPLSAVDAAVPARRRAILVGFGNDPAVPLALRGTDRVPWQDPAQDDSAVLGLREGGAGGAPARPSAGVWKPAARAGRCLPLPCGTRWAIGSASWSLNARPERSFQAADLDAVVRAGRAAHPNLDLSVVFAGLRERAGFEERERLAREMHDGIAQELVALGFRVDSLRRGPQHGSPLATTWTSCGELRGARRPPAAHRRPADRRAARPRSRRHDRRPPAEVRLRDRDAPGTAAQRDRVPAAGPHRDDDLPVPPPRARRRAARAGGHRDGRRASTWGPAVFLRVPHNGCPASSRRTSSSTRQRPRGEIPVEPMLPASSSRCT